MITRVAASPQDVFPQKSREMSRARQNEAKKKDRKRPMTEISAKNMSEAKDMEARCLISREQVMFCGKQ